MNKRLISVVVAVYNVERYLCRCLDSIAGQTHKELEIICVDDGSVDSSPEILKEYAAKDGRIRLFRKENEGLGGASARNYGLAKASGEYVIILDSDDYFDPEMLEKAYRKAEEEQTDIVLFGGFEHDDKSGADRRVESILKETALPEKEVFSYRDCSEKIFQISQGMAWNKLYRRSFLEKHGLRFQQIRYTDDAYFTFSHMVLAERIAAVREGLIYYRVNSGRNQTSGIADYPDSSFAPYLKLKESLVEWGIYEDVKRSFVNCVSVFIRYCYDMIGRYDAFVYLHDRLRKDVFERLDISGEEEGFYDDRRTFLWVRQVLENEAGELAFRAARAHGCADSTTGILRFQLPYDRIPANSRVVLIGERILGRHYLSQAVLSGHCDIVLWVGKENPQKLSYIHPLSSIREAAADCYLVAYSERDKVADTMDYLKSIGIEEEKIVLGV